MSHLSQILLATSLVVTGASAQIPDRVAPPPAVTPTAVPPSFPLPDFSGGTDSDASEFFPGSGALAQAPAPGIRPSVTPPALPPAVSPTGFPAGRGSEPMVPLQFLDTDVKDVLQLYERWTGRRLIYSTQLVGPIRIFISGQVPQSEAVKLVEMTLALNGFYINQSEDPKIWKVTGVGINPKQVGIPFVDREDMLPSNEQMVTFLFKLTNADPTELAQTIQNGILVPSQSGATSVIPLPRSQALLVTENTSIIRMLIRIVEAIDVEPAEVVSEFFTLEHAQAEDVATALKELFEKQQQQQAGLPGIPTAPRIASPGTGASGNPLPPGATASTGTVGFSATGSSFGERPTEDNIVVGKVRVTADKRTNRLHVVCRPINIKLIRALVKEYDAHVPLAKPAIRPLRFRPVEEVIEAVVAAVKDPGERDGAGGASGVPTPGGARRPTGQGAFPGQQGASNFGGSSLGSTSGSGSSAGALGESLSTTERDTQPLTEQVGKSTIIGDRRANSIIVVGPPDVTEKIFSLIDRLDVRQAQVMIHTVVGELRLTENEQFGLEYILRNGGILPTTTATPGTGTGTTTTDPASVGYDSNGRALLNLNNLLNQGDITKVLAAGAGGLSGYVAAGSAFAAALKTLESSNRFRVITRPSIFTSNNKRAVITSGEEVPVPTSIQSQFNNATTTTTNNLVSQSTIQFKPIELRLEVLPLINSDNEVSLEIVQNISERAGTTRIDNNDIPNISRRAIKTYVTVPSNGTLILGGLIKESMDRTGSGIPRLWNLPLIGGLFGNKAKAKVRTELIVIMRPVVTVNPSETAMLREKTYESFNIPPDLESAIMPTGIREKIPAPKKPSSLRKSAPSLREEASLPRR